MRSNRAVLGRLRAAALCTIDRSASGCPLYRRPAEEDGYSGRGQRLQRRVSETTAKLYCFTVPRDISDIGSADELIRYAVRAQLDLVGEAASDTWAASHNKIAQAVGMDGGNLARALTDGTFADAKLQRLDEVIVALAPAGAEHTGGLSSLAICLRGLRDRE